MTAIDVRKQEMLSGPKRPWSAATRAAIVALLLLNTTLRCKKLNQTVAAGPNIAIYDVSQYEHVNTVQ